MLLDTIITMIQAKADTWFTITAIYYLSLMTLHMNESMFHRKISQQ